MITYTVSIPASETYDIPPVSGNARVQSIVVSNIGANPVFYGHIPVPAFDRTTTIQDTQTWLTLQTEGDGHAIMPGMEVEAGSNLALGTKVTRVHGRRVYLDQAAIDTEGGVVTTFTAPVVSDSNGHPIGAGQSQRFEAHGGFSLQQGLRLAADSAGTAVTISLKFA